MVEEGHKPRGMQANFRSWKGKGTDSPIVPQRITVLPNTLTLGLLTSTTAK